GGHAAGVLEPDYVDGAGGVCVVKVGRLGGLVVLDGDLILDGQFDGPLVGDGLGPGIALDEGQGPVVAVVGNTQEDLARWDGGDRVVQHRPHVGQGGHRHGGTVGVAPLVGHQQDSVCGGGHGGVVVA